MSAVLVLCIYLRPCPGSFLRGVSSDRLGNEAVHDIMQRPGPTSIPTLKSPRHRRTSQDTQIDAPPISPDNRSLLISAVSQASTDRRGGLAWTRCCTRAGAGDKSSPPPSGTTTQDRQCTFPCRMVTITTFVGGKSGPPSHPSLSLPPSCPTGIHRDGEQPSSEHDSTRPSRPYAHRRVYNVQPPTHTRTRTLWVVPPKFDC